MSARNEFLNRIQNITNPETEEKINSGDPYVICDVLEETKGGPNGIYLKKLEDAIIATNDIVQIYEFMFMAVDMNVTGFDKERFERIIRESRNSKLMCYCMGFVPGTDIKLMLSALEQKKNAKYIEMLKQDDEYKDVFEEVMKIDSNYEEKIEEAKQFDYFPESLKEYMDLKDNINELKSEIKQTKNPHLITELANYIAYLNEYKNGNYDIEDLTKIQEEIKDPMQVYEFLASVNVKDKTNLIQAVIDSGRVKFMYYIYEYVPNLTEEEKDLLKEEIMKQDDRGKYKEMLGETSLYNNERENNE